MGLKEFLSWKRNEYHKSGYSKHGLEDSLQQLETHSKTDTRSNVALAVKNTRMMPLIISKDLFLNVVSAFVHWQKKRAEGQPSNLAEDIDRLRDFLTDYGQGLFLNLRFPMSIPRNDDLKKMSNKKLCGKRIAGDCFIKDCVCKKSSKTEAQRSRQSLADSLTTDVCTLTQAKENGGIDSDVEARSASTSNEHEVESIDLRSAGSDDFEVEANAKNDASHLTTDVDKSTSGTRETKVRVFLDAILWGQFRVSRIELGSVWVESNRVIMKVENASEYVRFASQTQEERLKYLETKTIRFSTEEIGMRFKTRLYLNGEGSSESSHLSVFIIITSFRYKGTRPPVLSVFLQNPESKDGPWIKRVKLNEQSRDVGIREVIDIETMLSRYVDSKDTLLIGFKVEEPKFT